MKKLFSLIIAGIAVKYFLDSAKGKKVQSQVKDWLGEAQDTFQDRWKTASNKTRRAADELS